MLSRALDPEIRNMFKTIEFQSIGHLLDVCHQHRDELQNVNLPKAQEDDIEKQVSDPKLLKQAMKDVRREKITVNGRSLPPAKTLKELVFVLTEALNSKPLTLSHGKNKRRKSKRSKKQAAAAASPFGKLTPQQTKVRWSRRQSARARFPRQRTVIQMLLLVVVEKPEEGRDWLGEGVLLIPRPLST